jgi:hypothetical protein
MTNELINTTATSVSSTKFEHFASVEELCEFLGISEKMKTAKQKGFEIKWIISTPQFSEANKKKYKEEYSLQLRAVATKDKLQIALPFAHKLCVKNEMKKAVESVKTSTDLDFIFAQRECGSGIYLQVVKIQKENGTEPFALICKGSKPVESREISTMSNEFFDAVDALGQI